MRITFTDDELNYVLDRIQDNKELVNSIDEQIKQQNSFTKDRKENIKIAIQAKADIAKNSVYKALETLNKQGIKITAEEIMKIANVSKNTALKYRREWAKDK